MDVIARLHGGGISAQAGRIAPRGFARVARRRSQPARGAQAPRLPHARLACQGAQEGPASRGTQAAAVLQALGRRSEASMAASCSGPTRPRRRRRVLTAELALALGRAATRRTGAGRPQVLVLRDTRESGEMLGQPFAAGVSAAGGERCSPVCFPTPAAPSCSLRYQLDLRGRAVGSQTPTRTTASSSSAVTATALRRDRARDRA